MEALVKRAGSLSDDCFEKRRAEKHFGDDSGKPEIVPAEEHNAPLSRRTLFVFVKPQLID